MRRLYPDEGLQFVQEMSKKIVGSILKNGTKVSSVAKVEMLFDFIMPLIGDASEDVPEDEDESVSVQA